MTDRKIYADNLSSSSSGLPKTKKEDTPADLQQRFVLAICTEKDTSVFQTESVLFMYQSHHTDSERFVFLD